MFFNFSKTVCIFSGIILVKEKVALLVIIFYVGHPPLNIAFSIRRFVSPECRTIGHDFGPNVLDLVQIVQCL